MHAADHHHRLGMPCTRGLKDNPNSTGTPELPVTIGAHRRRVIDRSQHLGRRVTTVLGLVAVVIVMTAAAADASGVEGPTPFGVTPAQTAGSPARSYFKLTIIPGRSGADTVIITNRGNHIE